MVRVSVEFAERNIYIKYGSYVINIINNKIMLLVKMQ